MARDRQPEPFPCPFCHTEVPGDARHCPSCRERLVEFCSDCGHKLRRPRGWSACPNCGAVPGADAPASGAAAGAAGRRCPRCGEELMGGERDCPRCHRYLASFVRLCPFCAKPVGMKANACPHCARKFPLSVERRLSHVVCAACGKSSELDDWMADLNLPALFRTRKGVKVAWLEPIEHAARTWVHFFEPPTSHLNVWDVTRRLLASDEEPWAFPSQRKAIEFLNSYPCTCGAKHWRMSVAAAISKLATEAGPPLLKASRIGWGILRGAGKELGLFDKFDKGKKDQKK